MSSVKLIADDDRIYGFTRLVSALQHDPENMTLEDSNLNDDGYSSDLRIHTIEVAGQVGLEGGNECGHALFSLSVVLHRGFYASRPGRDNSSSTSKFHVFS